MPPTTTRSPQSRSRRRPRRSAEHLDKHQLYEQAVQNPESEIRFYDRVFRKHRGRRPVSLREDFCGTALTSCTWVRHRPDATAVGVDLDADVLEWARRHNLAWLGEDDRRRLRLVNGNVLTARSGRTDLVVAANFSYFIFKTRDALRDYFRAARRNLKPDGLFVCDCFGGFEAQQELEETRKCSGFTYVWDQAKFNPITNEITCHIHFRFPSGRERRRAFSYDWRLWSITEIRELMAEAGFAGSTVYWEGTDSETGEGNGVFRPSTHGEVCAGWIAYIVAEP